jgi:hypothetical protein
MNDSDIIQKLDVKALPYVIFLVVPILGRMSDPDDDIRSAATNTFASLVKMVPLEVSGDCSLRDIPPTSPRLVYRTLPVSLKNFFEGGMKNVSSWRNSWMAAKSNSTHSR